MAINSFREKMESFTRVKITEQRLGEAIALCNKERELLRKISLMRKSDPLPLTGSDFVTLNHASLIADKEFMVQTLESVIAELEKREVSPSAEPRILLTGSTLAYGDDKIYTLVEEAGGAVVVEEFAEGLKYYWDAVELDGDLMKALADTYFQKRVVPAWFRPAKERRDFLLKLAKEFSADGVIWYHLMYRDSYTLEATLLPKILKEATGLSMLTLVSDYDVEEIGPLRTRIETFIETIRRK
jgi:benzoyl-CoA reductase/2-hydroxyglutaryl-CoA dehydratase subunit BcrC/BadD/HgdB